MEIKREVINHIAFATNHQKARPKTAHMKMKMKSMVSIIMNDNDIKVTGY
jgi:hypothetical protein